MNDHRSYIRNLSSCAGIAEVMGSNPVQAWIFFRLNFRNCLNCVYNCDDHSLIHYFFSSSSIWIFIYSLVSYNYQWPIVVICDLKKKPAVSLVSQWKWMPWRNVPLKIWVRSGAFSRPTKIKHSSTSPWRLADIRLSVISCFWVGRVLMRVWRSVFGWENYVIKFASKRCKM